MIDRCWWQRWRWRWYAVWSCCQGLYDGLFFEHSFEAAKVSQRADVPSRSKLIIWIYFMKSYNTSQSVYNHLLYIYILYCMYALFSVDLFLPTNYAGKLTYVDANVGCWFVFEVSQLPWKQTCGLTTYASNTGTEGCFGPRFELFGSRYFLYGTSHHLTISHLLKPTLETSKWSKLQVWKIIFPFEIRECSGPAG